MQKNKFIVVISSFFSKIFWLIKELIKVFSNEKSYFSKKRIESAIAFVVGQYGMIYFLLKHINTMSTTDIAMWAGIEFFIAGYVINQIQKEKKENKNEIENL